MVERYVKIPFYFLQNNSLTAPDETLNDVIAKLNKVCDGNTEFYNSILTVAEQQNHAEAYTSSALNTPVLTAAIPEVMCSGIQASQPRAYIGQTKRGFAGKFQAMKAHRDREDYQFSNPLPSPDSSEIVNPTTKETWESMFLNMKKNQIKQRARVLQKKRKNSDAKIKRLSKKEKATYV